MEVCMRWMLGEGGRRGMDVVARRSVGGGGFVGGWRGVGRDWRR
jgi:hypothetical protein